MGASVAIQINSPEPNIPHSIDMEKQYPGSAVRETTVVTDIATFGFGFFTVRFAQQGFLVVHSGTSWYTIS
ncbi:MAG: hypothetical protein CVV46_04125 [Spirochaetae bacterium HGW-Spirochaetae-2]|nr:MAG: hypothetical protein CVV46_04125 [Spirochaetae bacterium HGW-Spirochaetae-2]